MTAADHKNRRAGGKRTRLMAALVILLCAACIAGWLYVVTRGESGEAPDPSAPDGLIYDDAAVEGGWESRSREEIEESLNQQVEAGYINISMNASPVFENGRAQGNLMIVNETVNRYPQQVVITRDDTGETIYTSAAIPVGSKIAADTLDADLEAGTYECTAMFHSLDPDTGAILGSAGANINITIQN